MTTTPPTRQKNQHSGVFGQGVLLGLLLGGIVGLWNAPCSGADLLKRLRARVTSAPTVDDALQEGRDAAHQHRAKSARRLTT